MIQSVFCAGTPTTDALERLRSAGFNALTLPVSRAEQALIHTCRAFGFQVYLEVALFVGETYWQRFEGARPVDRSGRYLGAINGYYGVCPNHPQVRAERLEVIRGVLELEGVTGLYLDFIRYPCHWEAVRSADITDYCFCPNCLRGFRESGGDEPQGEAWVAWKCGRITSFVEDVRALIEARRSEVTLGLFAVPWQDDDFAGALRKVVAQDRQALAKVVDYFAPMVYHALTANPVSWIAEISSFIKAQTLKPVVPVVQAADAPTAISPHSLGQALELALGSSANVMVFHEDALLQAPQKLATCKQVLRGA